MSEYRSEEEIVNSFINSMEDSIRQSIRESGFTSDVKGFISEKIYDILNDIKLDLSNYPGVLDDQ